MLCLWYIYKKELDVSLSSYRNRGIIIMAVDENYQRKLEDQKRLFKQLGIKFDALTIHEKDFATKMRGYSQEEVDFFLDDVILDYERFYKVITDLLDKYNELQRRQTYESERASARMKEVEDSVDRSIVTDAIGSLEKTIDQLKVRLRDSDNKKMV